MKIIFSISGRRLDTIINQETLFLEGMVYMKNEKIMVKSKEYNHEIDFTIYDDVVLNGESMLKEYGESIKEMSRPIFKEIEFFIKKAMIDEVAIYVESLWSILDDKEELILKMHLCDK